MKRFFGVSAVLALTGALIACTPVEPEPYAPAVTITLKQSAPEDAERHWVQQKVQTLSLAEKAGKVLMLHLPGTSGSQLKSFADQHQLGGLILMGSNIPAQESQLASITSTINSGRELPLLLAIDQEGGVVRRLRSLDSFPAGAQIRNGTTAVAQQAFQRRGAMLESLGVNVNFGIVADVTSNSRSFIWSRILGATPADSANKVAAAVSGEHGFVFSTLKHFPGHGAVAGDSHIGIPQTNLGFADWNATAAKPFQAGIEAGAELVMMGHLVFSAVDPLPAVFSEKWYSILRDDLGFEGIIITDDMLMLNSSGDRRYNADPAANGVAALRAGATMILYVLSPNESLSKTTAAKIRQAVVTAVESGTLPAEALDQKVELILSYQRQLASDTGRY